ncbi:MAG: CsiV family protein [Gammaproteobacteria bacterium]
MRRLERAALCALLLLLASPAVWARWYQVEVVVFRHAGTLNSSGEMFPALASLPDYDSAMRLVTELPDLADEPGALPGAAPVEVAFRPLPRAERRLAGAAARVASGDYELLLAAAWRQPSFGVAGARRVYLSDLDEGGAAPIRLGPGGVPLARTPRVEGTVAIKVARLLHVEVDFVYDHDGTPVRLAETRRVKLRETHYFDHPLFGVLVQVAPYVLPEPDAPENAAGADEPEDPGEDAAASVATPAD